MVSIHFKLLLDTNGNTCNAWFYFGNKTVNNYIIKEHQEHNQIEKNAIIINIEHVEQLICLDKIIKRKLMI